ncbi:MAG: hypothetical protein FJX77_18265, partial [Armatimonadetes bacterium]|nr:hypothetical protein [Armatimonadota bacterium]
MTLHRRTVACRAAAGLLAAVVLVPALLQWSFVHFDVEGHGSYAVVVRSGFPELYDYALPGGCRRREDTGLTQADLVNREAVEALRAPYWRSSDPAKWRPLIENLKPDVRAVWEWGSGNWEAGLQALEAFPEQDQAIVWARLGRSEPQR